MFIDTNQNQVVFFASKLTAEEEYTVMMQPAPRKELPVQPISGNFALPSSADYLKPVDLSNHRSFTPNNMEVYNTIVALLHNEPFYNLLKIFKERAEFSYEMKFFGLLGEIADLISSKNTERRSTLNVLINKVFRIINQTECLRIYETILSILNEEFLKFYYFKKTGWEIQGDRIFELVGEKYDQYSPISELFVTEIKRVSKKKNIAEPFDIFCIKEGDMEGELNNRLEQTEVKRPIKKYPAILVLKFTNMVELKETIKFGFKNYILKSAITEDNVLETCPGSGNYIMGFYRVSKMNE